MKSMLMMFFVASGLLGGGALLSKSAPAVRADPASVSCEPGAEAEPPSTNISCLQCERAGGYCCKVGFTWGCC